MEDTAFRGAFERTSGIEKIRKRRLLGVTLSFIRCNAYTPPTRMNTGSIFGSQYPTKGIGVAQCPFVGLQGLCLQRKSKGITKGECSVMGCGLVRSRRVWWTEAVGKIVPCGLTPPPSVEAAQGAISISSRRSY